MLTRITAHNPVVYGHSGLSNFVGIGRRTYLDPNATTGVTQGSQTNTPNTATQQGMQGQQGTGTQQPPPVSQVITQGAAAATQQTLPPGMTADQMQSMTQGILGAIGPTIQAAIATAVTPITQQTQALATRVEQLAQPQGNIQQLFGGGQGGHGQAPVVRQGESVLSSRGFQFQRIAGYHMGHQSYGPEQCKAELEFCQDLEQYYRQSGMGHLLSNTQDSRGRSSTLVPLSPSMIPDECHRAMQQKWGSIAVLISQGVSGANSERLRWQAQRANYGDMGRVNQAMSIFDDAAMGIFTEAGPHGDLITLIRNREALSQLGATQLTLPPNGFLPFPKQTGTGTAYWVGEAQAITASQPTTGRMEMRAKKLAALMTVPNELLSFASVDTEAFLRADMAAVMGLKADLAGLEGAGTTNEPRGLLNYAGLTTHTRTVTVGADGNEFNPNTPQGMITDLEELNYDPESDGFAFLMRSKMWSNIVDRRASAHTAGTYDGNYLFPVNRDDIGKGRPTMLRGFPVRRSSQVSNTRSKGSSSDLSYVLGGIWKHLLIGRIGVMEFAMSNSGDTNFANYQTSLRTVQFIDIAPRYENAFVLADTIDMDLPAA